MGAPHSPQKLPLPLIDPQTPPHPWTPWTRPTYHAKRHPDPIRRFSTVHWTDKQTNRWLTVKFVKYWPLSLYGQRRGLIIYRYSKTLLFVTVMKSSDYRKTKSDRLQNKNRLNIINRFVSNARNNWKKNCLDRDWTDRISLTHDHDLDL